MPRRKLIRQNQFPYHVTSRTNNKEWFKIPLNRVWKYCKKSFEYANLNHNAKIHCFVLMNNHYHLLISTPDENIDSYMMYFNQNLGRLISQDANVINHKFSNRYKWTIVDNQSYLYNVYRYIFQNPIRAGIVDSIIDYPYSSIFFQQEEIKKLNYESHFNWKNNIDWLNTYYGSGFDNLIRKCLKKEYFKPHQKISRIDKTRLCEILLSC